MEKIIIFWRAKLLSERPAIGYNYLKAVAKLKINDQRHFNKHYNLEMNTWAGWQLGKKWNGEWVISNFLKKKSDIHI